MSKQTTARYAVMGKTSTKVLKNAETREIARQWKRNSGKTNLRIYDRHAANFIR